MCTSGLARLKRMTHVHFSKTVFKLGRKLLVKKRNVKAEPCNFWTLSDHLEELSQKPPCIYTARLIFRIFFVYNAQFRLYRICTLKQFEFTSTPHYS